MTRFAICLVVALTACTGFDSLQRNICGNGLIEPGEDCDSNDASCVRCAVACTRSAECPTSDYTCGTDGLCHAPGGALGQPVQAGTFLVSDFRISDVDHDGAGDVLGLSSTSIVVRHGDAAGRLAQSDTLFTPSQSGPPSFGDLDDDGALDLTLSTPDGLVTYTSTFGELSPLDVPSELTGMSGELLSIKSMFQPSIYTLGVFIVDPTNHVFLGALDFLTNDQQFAAPCAPRIGLIDAATFSIGSIDVYQVSRKTDPNTDTVISLVGGTGAAAKLCVMAIHQDNPLAPIQFTDITPNIATPAERPLLADLNTTADRCPGIVNIDGGPQALRYFDGFLSGNHCAIRNAASTAGDPVLPIPSTTTKIIGRVPIDPPVSLVVGDALVTTDGVYALVPLQAQWDALYRTTRKLAHIASGDINGDGNIDAVISAQGADDLDVLYRSVSPAGFQVLRLDTANEATSVTLGDFDGNGCADIAYTETIGSHQRMMIAYATVDHPLTPVQVGEFGSIDAISTMAFGDSVDQFSLDDDLAVLQPPVNGVPTLTLLHGSPNRTMMPYFDPRSSPVQKTTTIRGTAIGRFITGPGAEHRDILVLAADTATGAIKGFPVAGTDTGLDGTPSDGVTIPGLVDCATSGSGICAQTARYFTWPISATRDVVIAVDQQSSPHVGVIDPWSSLSVTPAAAMMNKIPSHTQLTSLYASDLDGDGNLDLVAAFAPLAAADRGAILICQVANGTPQSCDDLVPAIIAKAPGTHACVDAAPGLVTLRDPLTAPTPGTDLVVLCHDDGSTIYRVRRTLDGYQIDALVHSASLIDAIRVGDVTGDGVVDVVGLEGALGAQSLVVYPQCTSRTLASCQLGIGGGS